MIIFFSIGLICLKSSFLSSADEVIQKIGYVDTTQVFQTLPQLELVLRQMKEEFKDKADELKIIQSDARIKIDKLNRDSNLMSLDEIEKLRIEISQLESTYKIKFQALEKASSLREAEEKQKLFKVIQDAVKEVAEKGNYDMILDIKAFIYAKPNFNISQEVIEALKK
nr:OmpH family outer membrane protein [Candidatus Photodesmus katoptron]